MSSPPTVLIVEDDPVFRRVLSFTVAKSGLAVVTANDGDQGFEMLMKGGIDFVVTDLQMPGCGGVELLQRLAAVPNFNRPPAVLCTAKGLELDTERLRREFQLTAIMHKPFSPRKLKDLLLEHLGNNTSQPTSPTSCKSTPCSIIVPENASEIRSPSTPESGAG